MQQYTKCKFGFCGKDIPISNPNNPKTYRNICDACVEEYTPYFGFKGNHYASRIWKKARAMVDNAKSRNKYKVEITYEDILEIWPKDRKCSILGVEMYVAEGVHGDRRHSPSLDRIDSNKGYTKDNIQIVSTQANRLMSNATREELINFSKWINKTYSEN